MCFFPSLSPPPQLVGGYLQLRYNLGSGEVVARVTGRQFGEGDYHEVEVRRDGRAAVMWVDSLYVARATAPGLDMYLDVRPGGIFLGGAAGEVSGTVENGFRGCLRGATVDGKLLPLSASNEDFEVSYSGLDTPTFGCWVPPIGPITTSTTAIPLLYIILIVVVVALLLIVVACVVTVAIAHRCRKTRKRTRTSLYEMRDEDFEPPRLTIEYWGEQRGVSRNSAGNIRSYDHEGGGESDVGMMPLDVNSTLSHSADDALGSRFSTFTSTERESSVRTAQPPQPPPGRLTREPDSHDQNQCEDRYVTRREGEATSASTTAEPRAELPTEVPLPRVTPKAVTRREAAMANTSFASESAASLTAASVRPPVKPKPVNVPQPKARLEAAETSTSVLAEPAASPAEAPVPPPVKPKPVNVPVPQPMSRREAKVGGISAAKSAEALPTEAPVLPGKHEAVKVQVPHPKSHSKPELHVDAKENKIRKRKEAADAVVLQDDFDETKTFADEGNMTPLGYASLRSLYQMQDTEDDSGVPTITGPSAPRFSHLLALLRELNVTDDNDDDVSSISTADSITSDTIQAGVADQSDHRTPPPIPVKKHKSKFLAGGVTVRQV